MQGVIPLLAAHDGWKVPTQIRMGGWHARSDTLAASLSSACMARLTSKSLKGKVVQDDRVVKAGSRFLGMSLSYHTYALCSC